jgi:hypothetical protein
MTGFEILVAVAQIARADAELARLQQVADDIRSAHVCYKCAQPVAPTNDARFLRYLAFEDTEVLDAVPLHLLPLVVDGKVVCEGSPSRAQYLEGQPKDTRGYPYLPERQAPYRAAYQKLLQVAAKAAEF